MESMKLRIKTNLLELEYEGGNQFVQDHLTQLLEKLAEISVAPRSIVAQVNSELEQMSSVGTHQHELPHIQDVPTNSAQLVVTQNVSPSTGNADNNPESQSPFNFKKLQELADHSLEDSNVSAYGLIRPKGLKG